MASKESVASANRVDIHNPDIHLKQKQIYSGTKIWGEIYSLYFTPEGDKLLAGYGNGAVLAFNAEDDKIHPLYQVKKAKHGGLPTTAIRCLPKHPDKILTSCADGKLYVSSMEDGDGEEKINEKGNGIFTFGINMKGDMLATAGKDMGVRLYDAATFRLVETYSGYMTNRAEQSFQNTHAQRVFSLVWHPEQNAIFLTGGWDNHIKVWDSRLREPVVAFLEGPHICGDAIDIKNDTVLTGSWLPHNALQLWDLRFRKLIKDIPFDNADPKNPGEYLYCCKFGDGDIVIAGSGGSNCLKVIRHEEGKEVGKLDMVGGHAVNCMARGLGGKKIAFGGMCSEIIYAGLT